MGAVEEQVEEEWEGVRSRGLPGLIGVGVSGRRRRLVTSPSGAGPFRWRLTAA
jgi:hypothetical protein